MKNKKGVFAENKKKELLKVNQPFFLYFFLPEEANTNLTSFKI